MTPRQFMNAFATQAMMVLVLITVGATVPGRLPHVMPSALHASQQTQSPAPGRVFASDAGMVLNTIKPERTADFELVMAKLKEALQKSDKPERKQQAVGWRVYKATEPGANNSVLYVFWINPAVKGTDYTVSKILAEVFPSDVQELYKKFSDAYAGGQTFVNLSLIAAMGQQASARELLVPPPVESEEPGRRAQP